MTRRIPLPQSLDPDAFSVTEALSEGVSPNQLRALSLHRTVWGVRSSREPADVAERCRLFARRLRPDAFFSHRTAAVLHGLPVPPSRSESPPIDVSVAAPDRAPHAAGIVGHSLEVAVEDVVLLGDLRVTSAHRTWFDLAKSLSVPDLVAAGDRIINRGDSLGTPAQLAGMVEAHPGERGVRRLSAALDLLDGRSESPQESRLRAILVTAGITRPEVNLDIVDRAGRFLGRGDLVWPAQHLVIEYQGDYHRDRAQWRADMTRRGRLEGEGWRVLEVNADDLKRPEDLIRRVRALLGR